MEQSKEFNQGFVEAAVKLGCDRAQTKELHKIATVTEAMNNEDFREGFLEKKAFLAGLGKLIQNSAAPVIAGLGAGLAGLGLGGYLGDKSYMWRKNLGKDRRSRELNNRLAEAMDFDDPLAATRYIGKTMEDSVADYQRFARAMGESNPYRVQSDARAYWNVPQRSYTSV